VLGVLIVAGCSREPAPEGTATVPWAPSTTVGPSTVMSVVESTLPASTVGVVPTLVESADEAEIRRVVEGAFRAVSDGYLAGRDGPSEAKSFYTKALNDELSARLADRNAANERRTAGTTNLIEATNIKIDRANGLATATQCLKNDIQVWDTVGTADIADDVLKDGSLATYSRDFFVKKEGGKWLVDSYDEAQVNSEFCVGVF
jgi:hypothetical protein